MTVKKETRTNYIPVKVLFSLGRRDWTSGLMVNENLKGPS